MARIAIIGAGISGPAAALALTHEGHDVTVYEARQASELHSPGILGITDANWTMLTFLGANIHEYDNSYTVYGGETRTWDGHYVEWTYLHNALIEAATRHGATFRFGITFDMTDFSSHDYIIIAAGVGHASKTSHANYSGYVVYRGLSSEQTDHSWLVVSDDAKRWHFTIGRTDNGASWTLYSHLPKPRPMGTTSIDSVNPDAYDGLPAEFASYITSTHTMYRAAISDWDVPESMFSGWHTITIGDANGAMRPHTGMGANLGISEALATPDLLSGNRRVKMTVDQTLLINREIQRNRGVQLGQGAMGV